jgi:hypothetical protein
MLGTRYLWGYVAMWPRRVLPILPVDQNLRNLDGEARAAWRAGMRVASVATGETPNPLPRVRMLSRVRFSMQPDVDIGAIDVETTALVNRIAHVDPGKPGVARIASEEPGDFEIETSAAGRQMLVVSESFHEGWRVWIDGEPGSLLRAYGDFIGCVVPAGDHRVRLHFEPDSFRQGARISGLALAAILAWSILAFVRARGVRPAPVPR